MNIHLATVQAREKHGLPIEWGVFRWEAFPKDRWEMIYVELTGAICTHKFSRGKRVGTTNWSKRDRSSERTISITRAEHQAWIPTWEARTGKCAACEGNGEVFHSWSLEAGTKNRPCSVCDGSGRAAARAAKGGA